MRRCPGAAATSSGVPMLGDRAVVEHQQPVGEREHVERVVGDQQRDAVEVREVRGAAGRAAPGDRRRRARRTARRAAAAAGRSPARGRARPAAPARRRAGRAGGRRGRRRRDGRARSCARRSAARTTGAAGARAEGDVLQRGQVREQQRAPGAPVRPGAVAGGSRTQSASPTQPTRALGRHRCRRAPAAAWSCRRRWGRATATISPGSAVERDLGACGRAGSPATSAVRALIGLRGEGAGVSQRSRSSGEHRARETTSSTTLSATAVSRSDWSAV